MGSTDWAIMSDTNEQLMSYFDKSAAAVLRVFGRVEKHYLRPASESLIQLSQQRPILAICGGIFAALSLLPLLAFIGFSLFTFGTLVFVALAGATLASLLVVIITGSVLACVLGVLLTASVMMTACGVGAYLMARVVIRVRADGLRTGVVEWTKETKHRMYTQAPAPSAAAVGPEGDKTDDEGSESDTIIVGSVVAPKWESEGPPHEIEQNGENSDAEIKEEY